MSRNTIIAGSIALILIMLGGWYLLSHASTENALMTSEAATTTQQVGAPVSSASGTNPTTLKTVLAQGGNYTCALETIKNGTHMTGTVYGTANKFRFDFTVSQNGVDTHTHIIRIGTTAYTWVDGKLGGTASAVAAGSHLPQPNGYAISIDENTDVTTDCHPWIPDASQFVPPTTITFTRV
jgi:hypothetical protein